MVAFVKYFMLPGLENLWNEPLKCNDLGDYSFGTSYSTVTNLYKHWINQFLYVKSFSRIVHGYDATVVDVTVVLWLKPCCVNICWLFSWRICLQKKNVQCSIKLLACPVNCYSVYFMLLVWSLVYYLVCTTCEQKETTWIGAKCYKSYGTVTAKGSQCQIAPFSLQHYIQLILCSRQKY